MSALHVEDLTIRLPNGYVLVNQLSFTIQPDQILALMGPSGSGKSSILSYLTGTADKRLNIKGSVWLGKTLLNPLPTEKRQLGLMLQQDYLFPHMSVGDNLLFGLRGGSSYERLAKVKQSLSDAGLADMENRDPATLSGGQRARVSLIRTLLSTPSALLLDEPFAALDTTLREQIRQFTWRKAQGLPVLLVTHDMADVPPNASIITLSGEHETSQSVGSAYSVTDQPRASDAG